MLLRLLAHSKSLFFLFFSFCRYTSNMIQCTEKKSYTKGNSSDNLPENIWWERNFDVENYGNGAHFMNWILHFVQWVSGPSPIIVIFYGCLFVAVCTKMNEWIVTVDVKTLCLFLALGSCTFGRWFCAVIHIFFSTLSYNRAHRNNILDCQVFVFCVLRRNKVFVFCLNTQKQPLPWFFLDKNHS